MSVEEKLYGCQSMTGELRRVLVRAPRAEDLHGWQQYGWRSEPDAAVIAREHEAFCALLEDAGAEVVLAESRSDGNPDAIYTYDPALVADEGALLLHPGKECRRAEVDAMPRTSSAPVSRSRGGSSDPAWAEGGDCCWLDERTLLVGCGYRTNEAGIARLRELLPGVEVLAFDLPHWHGRDEVMHLMSLISPLARTSPSSTSRSCRCGSPSCSTSAASSSSQVPDEEFDSMGSNVLALAPRVALALDGNPGTRERMERAGVEVLTYRGEELSKGDGGPTCLTRPLLRV